MKRRHFLLSTRARNIEYEKKEKKQRLFLLALAFHFNRFSMIQIFDMFEESITGCEFFFTDKTLQNYRSFTNLKDLNVYKGFRRGEFPTSSVVALPFFFLSVMGVGSGKISVCSSSSGGGTVSSSSDEAFSLLFRRCFFFFFFDLLEKKRFPWIFKFTTRIFNQPRLIIHW